jgi:hypothetical protein
MNERPGRKPNWWRIVAIASFVLCAYTTWLYIESRAQLEHLLEHERAHHASEHNAESSSTNASALERSQ